jgi:hypothetical protein
MMRTVFATPRTHHRTLQSGSKSDRTRVQMIIAMMMLTIEVFALALYTCGLTRRQVCISKSVIQQGQKF